MHMSRSPAINDKTEENYQSNVNNKMAPAADAVPPPIHNDKNRTLTRSSVKGRNNRRLQREEQNIDFIYQKKYGFLVFSLMLIFILIINLPFMVITYNIQDKSVTTSLKTIGLAGEALKGKIESAFGLAYQDGVATEEELLGIQELQVAGAREITALIQDLRKNCKTAWDLALISGLIHILISLSVIGCVIWQKESRLVKSRGKHFLIHLLVCIPIALIFGLISTAVALLQIPAFDPILVNGDVYRDAYYAFGIVFLFFGHALLSALISRSRLVYLAYNLANAQEIGPYTYWKIMPLHITTYIFMLVIITVFTYANHDMDEKWVNVHSVPVQMLYLSLIGYLTFKLKDAAIEYSDLYINLRCMCFEFVFITSAILLQGLTDTFLDAIIFQYAYFSFAVLYLLDQFSSLFFTRYMVRRHSSNATGTNKTSRTGTSRTQNELVVSKNANSNSCWRDEDEVITVDCELHDLEEEQKQEFS
eukprot:Awhi_evm1s4778